MNAWITLALWVASKEQLARISFEPGPKGVVTVRQTSGKHFLKKSNNQNLLCKHKITPNSAGFTALPSASAVCTGR